MLKVALAFCAAALPLFVAAASAGENDLLVGLDSKMVYGRNGQMVGPADGDAVLVLDISNPAAPKIRASLPLANSLLGPPTNLQITPDGRFGLIASSALSEKKNGVWTSVPDNRVFVVELGRTPRLIDTVRVGRQPSGIAISHGGNLALVANRADKDISVLSIKGRTIKHIDDVALGVEPTAVAILPDGKRAFATLDTANKVAVLAIDGDRVTYEKTPDVPSAFMPFNLDVTANGKYAVISNSGLTGLNGDAEVTIAATGAHPHVVAIMTPGHGPEGFAISPDGKWAAAPLLLGTGSKPGAYDYTRHGELALMSIADNGALTVTGRAQLGALPEGIAYSSDSRYIYVGNYIDRTLQVFRIAGGKPIQVGSAITLPGQPAAIRGIAR